MMVSRGDLELEESIASNLLLHDNLSRQSSNGHVQDVDDSMGKIQPNTSDSNKIREYASSRCYVNLHVPSISISVIDSRERLELMEISVVDIDCRHADTARFAQVY